MKNLLNKEFRLSSHITMWLFPLLSALVLVPSYPCLIGPMYGCLAVFLTFQYGRENKDVLFTVILPVAKRDAVRARVSLVVIMQLMQLLVAGIGCILRPSVLPAELLINAAGIEANAAMMGFAFGMFALFNIIFLPTFYKSGYKCGIAFLTAGIAVMVYIGLVELTVAVVPAVRAVLDNFDPACRPAQFAVLAAGVLVYAGLTFVAYRMSAARFDRVDL